MQELLRDMRTWTGVGIIAGLVVGFGTVIAEATDTAISLTLGLVTVLLGAFAGALGALEGRLDRLDDSRLELQPFRELHEVPQLAGPLAAIVSAVASTHDSRSAFMLGRTTEAVRDFSEVIRQMANGVFEVHSDSEELALVKQALAETQTKVRAIAARGPNWWLDEQGRLRSYPRMYFRAYERAAERLDITRIFIVDPGDFERMKPILERQSQAGVCTYAVDSNCIPIDGARPLVLFDDRLLHKVQVADESEPRPLVPETNGEDPSRPHRVLFSDVAQELDEAAELFEALLDLVEDEQACLYRLSEGSDSQAV